VPSRGFPSIFCDLGAEIDALLGFLRSDSAMEEANTEAQERKDRAGRAARLAGPSQKDHLATLVEVLLREIAAAPWPAALSSTRRVAISNVSADDASVTFNWEDYRIEGHARHSARTSSSPASPARTSPPISASASAPSRELSRLDHEANRLEIASRFGSAGAGRRLQRVR